MMTLPALAASAAFSTFSTFSAAGLHAAFPRLLSVLPSVSPLAPAPLSPLPAVGLLGVDAGTLDGAADLLRLLVVPGFAWAAYRDVRTRRVAGALWLPLAAVGLLALALEAVAMAPFAGYEGRVFLVRVAFALLFVVPLSVLAYRLAAFGGADMKALVVLAVTFPTTPDYIVPLWLLPEVTWLHNYAFPVYPSTLGVTAMSALTNAVLFGAGYVLSLGARNLLAGRVSPAMFVGRLTPVSELPTVHGQLLRVEGLRPRRGLDVDALRMYLRWRGRTLAELRADPARHRDPDSVTETHAPTDGAVDVGPRTDGGADRAEQESDERTGEFVFPGASSDSDSDAEPSADVADPWAAERFLDDIEGTAYGTTPETLREGLERVTSEETVWVSPGLPFLVPLFAGLALALTYGDLLTRALSLAGLV